MIPGLIKYSKNLLKYRNINLYGTSYITNHLVNTKMKKIETKNSIFYVDNYIDYSYIIDDYIVVYSNKEKKSYFIENTQENRKLILLFDIVKPSYIYSYKLSHNWNPNNSYSSLNIKKKSSLFTTTFLPDYSEIEYNKKQSFNYLIDNKYLIQSNNLYNSYVNYDNAGLNISTDNGIISVNELNTSKEIIPIIEKFLN